MDENRRTCLKAIGWAAAGLGCGLPLGGCIDLRREEGLTGADGEARQMAMVIDIDGVDDDVAKACIDACHREHNVPTSSDPARRVKWAWQEEFRHAFPDQVHGELVDALEHRRVLLMCNHCDNPACVKVCPTAATWKRKSDGIVMMDMHRCIGCRYCVVACPYGTRSFNWGDAPDSNRTTYPARSRGVVEKCNFCAERLREGLEPACVIAAREATDGAAPLTFGDVTDPRSAVSELLRTTHTITRKNALGTGPNVYYIVPDTAPTPDGDHAEAVT